MKGMASVSFSFLLARTIIILKLYVEQKLSTAYIVLCISFMMFIRHPLHSQYLCDMFRAASEATRSGCFWRSHLKTKTFKRIGKFTFLPLQRHAWRGSNTGSCNFQGKRFPAGENCDGIANLFSLSWSSIASPDQSRFRLIVTLYLDKDIKLSVVENDNGFLPLAFSCHWLACLSSIIPKSHERKPERNERLEKSAFRMVQSFIQTAKVKIAKPW